MSTTTEKSQDELVKELIAKAKAKKETIEKAERPNWQTGGQFGFLANSAHERIDIKTVTDTRKLVEIHAFITDRKDKSVVSAAELGVPYEFKWLGFTAEEWKGDILTRVNQLQIQAKRTELADIETRLNALVSPELRAKMELEEISAALS